VDIVGWVLHKLAFGVVLAQIVAGLYGLLIGLLLSRNVKIAVGLSALFGLSYSWSMFAVISIQGWGGGDFDFYLYQMRVIFLPSPLIAGSLGSVILAGWRRRTGRDRSWGRSLLVVLLGAVAFGGGGLLCTRIAAMVLAADPTDSSRDALDLALVISFYGPLLIGLALTLTAAWTDRRPVAHSPDAP
jgi:hypothetical protein